MLRSEEHRSASFWKGSEKEDGAKSVLADRIYALSQKHDLEWLCGTFGLSELEIFKIIEKGRKASHRERNKRWAEISRKATLSRKAAAKQRLKNWQELHAKVSA